MSDATNAIATTIRLQFVNAQTPSGTRMFIIKLTIFNIRVVFTPKTTFDIFSLSSHVGSVGYDRILSNKIKQHTPFQNE
jgi:hypothetical protein